jgi:hypothetical protein
MHGVILMERDYFRDRLLVYGSASLLRIMHAYLSHPETARENSIKPIGLISENGFVRVILVDVVVINLQDLDVRQVRIVV